MSAEEKDRRDIGEDKRKNDLWKKHMKFIFWNIKKIKNANDYLENLIQFYQPDIIGMAEYASAGQNLVEKLNAAGIKYAYSPKIGSRVDVFYRSDKMQIIHCGENHYYSVKIFINGKNRWIIAIVHLPSKLHKNDYDDVEILHDLLDEVERVKLERGIDYVVIMGDFNMNPFESPMIAASGLQAVPSGKIAKKENRIYRDRRRSFYYNPMWNFLGDEKRPMGSFFYNSPGNEAFYWNTFDQFVVSPSLVDEVRKESIHFVNRFEHIVLENRNGKPKVSDHFPLYFEIGRA